MGVSVPKFPDVPKGDNGEPLGWWGVEVEYLGTVEGVDDPEAYASAQLVRNASGGVDVRRTLPVMEWHPLSDAELSERDGLSAQLRPQAMAQGTMDAFVGSFMDDPSSQQEDDFRAAWARCARAVSLMVGRMTDVPDSEAVALGGVVPPWKPGEMVEKGSLRTFGGSTWRCLQSHSTQAGWEPGWAASSLWSEVSYAGDVEVWSEPGGAYDAYSVGDRVSHNGKVYTSLINGNFTVPGHDQRWWRLDG